MTTGNIKNKVIARDMLMGITFCMVIFAVIFAFPLLGVFTLILLPQPVLFYRLKLGRKAGGIIVAVCFALLMVLTQGLGFDLLYFGALLMTGLILGECIERHMGIERTILVTAFGVGLIGIAGLFSLAAVDGRTLAQMGSEYVTQYFAMTGELYSEMGIEEQQITLLNSAILFVLPGMFIISLISTMWLNILIIKKLLLKRGISLNAIENLNHYRAPEFLVWAVIGVGLLLFVPANGVKFLSINCLIVLMLVYFFQGIAIVSYYFQKKGSPTILKVFCYSLIAVQIYVLLLVIGLGFFDNWINFRKLNQDSGIQNG